MFCERKSFTKGLASSFSSPRIGKRLSVSLSLCSTLLLAFF